MLNLSLVSGWRDTRSVARGFHLLRGAEHRQHRDRSGQGRLGRHPRPAAVQGGVPRRREEHLQLVKLFEGGLEGGGWVGGSL